MGFWDFIAPDYDEFVEVAQEVLPAAIAIGPIVLSGEEVAQVAWLTPAGGAGLALRLYYQARALGVPGAQADGFWTAVNDQARAGGFGAGPGGGGSFGWEAIKIMPTLIVPNTFRVAIEATSSGRAVTNVIGVRATGAGSAQDAAEAVLERWAGAGTTPIDELPTGYVLTQVKAVDLSSASGQVAIVPSGATGAKATQKSTNGACALVKMNGGTRSRSANGRLYFGPLVEEQIDPDGRTLASLFRTNLQDIFTAFRSGLQGDGYELVVVSPTLSQASVVGSLSVEPIIATQRRRIRG